MVARTGPKREKWGRAIFYWFFYNFQIRKFLKNLPQYEFFIFSKKLWSIIYWTTNGPKLWSIIYGPPKSRPEERINPDLRSRRPWTGPIQIELVQIGSIDINWSKTRPDRPDGPGNPVQNKRWYGKCIFIYKWMSLLWRIFKINFLSSDWRLVWSQSNDRFVFTWL